jgi:hypothetical protein
MTVYWTCDLFVSTFVIFHQAAVHTFSHHSSLMSYNRISSFISLRGHFCFSVFILNEIVHAKCVNVFSLLKYDCARWHGDQVQDNFDFWLRTN